MSCGNEEKCRKCVEHYAKLVASVEGVDDRILCKDFKSATFFALSTRLENDVLNTFGCISENLYNEIENAGRLLQEACDQSNFNEAVNQLRRIKSKLYLPILDEVVKSCVKGD